MKTNVTGNMEIYRSQLEARLDRQHRNHPTYGDKVEKVEVKIAKVVHGLNGIDKQVEYTQVVYDRWGQRIPELEQQYYVVQFGLGRPKISQDRPHMTIGMSADGVYSEKIPVRNNLMRQAESVAATPSPRFDPVTGKPVAQPFGEGGDALGSTAATALPGE